MTELDKVALLAALAVVIWVLLLPKPSAAAPRPLPARPTPAPEPEHRDPGDENDAVPEGLGVVDPRNAHYLFCVRCGRRDRSRHDEDLVPCPDCGGRHWSDRPDIPIIGERKERRV